VTQDDHIFDRQRLPWPASPGRALRIPSSILSGIPSDGGAITIDLE
jgi:hypothetical protein